MTRRSEDARRAGPKEGSAACPRVGLCVGKDCRKRSELTPLYEALQPACHVTYLPCIGVCKGPVVVVDIDANKPRIFRRLRSKKERRDLLRLVKDGGPPSDRLRAARVKGSKRKAALRRVWRALAG